MDILDQVLRPSTDLLFLASALRLLAKDEPAAVRAVERAVELLDLKLAYTFDGVELRLMSQQKEDVFYVTDGIACTCPGARRPWCKHRVVFRLLLAEWALAQPAYLRAMVVEQVVPEDTHWDTTGSFLDQLDRQHAEAINWSEIF